MKKTVWIVDDDIDVRDVLRTMLKILGYECRDFEDARTPAHSLMAEDIPDLMMIDINIPVVNGLELLSYIRRKPRWVHLPVIILSSESDEERVEQVVRMGADGYIFKPVTIEELDMAIRSATKRRRAVAAQ
jgi:two-component system, chemotaxis family, chemotaxis protein CheY